jgi:hypothetical protein
MKIKVTQEHINAGIRNNPCKCPLALALNEATGREWYVGGIWFNHKEKRESTRFRVTDQMWRFIHAFDCESRVEPTEFNVPIEEPA